MKEFVRRRLALATLGVLCFAAVGSTRQSPTVAIEDVTLAEGTGGTTTATFRVVLRNPNLAESRVYYLTGGGSATAGTSNWSYAGGLTIPTSGTASPYPATLNVSGMTGTIQHLAVRIDALTHTFPADIDMLLVGPTGQAVMMMSDRGGSDDVAGVSFTLMDGAPPIPTPIVPGTYAPTDNAPVGETLPAPAPSGPYGSTLSVFNGTNPNGQWRLYVVDDQSSDGGALGGVTLFIATTASGADYIPRAGLLTFPPGTPAQWVTVPVAADAVAEADETLNVQLFSPTNVAIADPLGTATILNDDGGVGPKPPRGLRVDNIAGSLLTLRWDPPLVGPVPVGYVLEAGTSPGGVIASLPLGPARTFSINAPPGSFYLRLRSTTAGGTSAVSNEVVAHVGVPVAPSAPADLLGNVGTSRVALSWRNTFTGAAPSTIVLDVSGTLSGSLPLGVTDTFTFNGMPNGTYTFSVRGVNAAGSGAPSAPVTLTFPGTCTGVLQAPRHFDVYKVGNVLTLLWDPPDLGPAPTGYVLSAGGAVSGSLPLTARGFSAAVPPGTYVFDVRSTHFCGTGTLTTPPVAIAVP
ncbi:MAG: Calx-beta domain-containing protein [Vicinamibacterales bacterium]